MTTDPNFFKLLSQSSLLDSKPKSNLIFSALTTDTVSFVFNGIMTHKILSAPIICSETGHHKGFVSLLDLLVFFWKNFWRIRNEKFKKHF